jgi:hypothetical protein
MQLFGMFVIMVILIVWWVYYIYLAHPDYPSYTYEELEPFFKTGDIILFHALDNINPIFIGTYYGHVGMIYVDPDTNKKYIVEAFLPKTSKIPDQCKNGIAFVDLRQRMNSYRGYCFYKQLEVPVDPDKVYGFREFIDFATKNMYYNPKVFSNSIGKIMFNDSLQLSTNCGEFVYLCLIKLGLLPITALESNQKHHLAWIANLNKVEKNEYRDPVYCLPSYFVPDC